MNNRISLSMLGILLLCTACTKETVETNVIGPINEGILSQEILNLTIEPEYVLAKDDREMTVSPVIEALNANGSRYGLFKEGELSGFTYEEGYRYKLSVKKIYLGSEIGSPQFEYRLESILAKEEVGIRQTGRRDVVMEVYPVMMRDKSTKTDVYVKLCGQIEGTDEKVDMMMCEVNGMKYEDFTNASSWVKVKIKASITPTDKPIFEWNTNVGSWKIDKRVRLIELLDKKTISPDSLAFDTIQSDSSGVAYGEADEIYGDYEIQWLAGEKVIGKGILNAYHGQESYFSYSLVPGTDFAMFFVNRTYTDPYTEAKVLDNLTSGGKINYNFVGNSAAAYYYSITWDYRAGVNIDGKEYLIVPVLEENKSTMLFDLKTKQWTGVIYISKIKLYEVMLSETKLLKEQVMSTPLQIVFNTVSKIK